jgi:hypothetical protein
MLSSPEKQAQLGGLDDRTFLEHLYEDTLHRHGDDDGLRYWEDQLEHGHSRVDVALGFVESHEHIFHLFDADVAGLYSGLLNRNPDGEGLHYFRDALERGATLDDVAKAFLASPEYQAKSAGVSSAAYVEDLYEHVLGRRADDGGLHYWQDQLEHGGSRAAVAVAIAHSPEAHEHLGPSMDGLWHL